MSNKFFQGGAKHFVGGFAPLRPMVTGLVRIIYNGKRTSTRTSRMHLRGLGNLCSSAVYNQVQLALIF